MEEELQIPHEPVIGEHDQARNAAGSYVFESLWRSDDIPLAPAS
jgi:hypothetical protein